MLELLIPALIMGAWGAHAGSKERQSTNNTPTAFNPNLFQGEKYLVNPPSGYNENPVTPPVGYSESSDYSSGGGIDIQGDEGFQRTVQGYIDRLSRSEEGRRVLAEAGNVTVVPADGVVSYGYGNTIELNPGLIGYGVFCHELRHCWQDATGFEGGGVARERDANLWQAGRAFESGRVIDGIVGLFMAFDPVTNAINAMYYGEEA